MTLVAMRFRSVALAMSVIACAGAPRSKRDDVGERMPAMTLPLLAGGTWSSDTTRGSVLVIDVWASWCKPCSKGFPRLEALAARGVTVIAISIDEDLEAMRGFLAEFPLAVPVAHDREQTVTRPPLRIAKLPAVLVIDATGVVRHRFEELTDRDYDEVDRVVSEVATTRATARP